MSPADRVAAWDSEQGQESTESAQPSASGSGSDNWIETFIGRHFYLNECCEATSLNLPGILLELGGRHIAQRRVEPLLVIDPLDEFANACLGLGQVTIFGSVNFLVLKRLHKALGLGIGLGRQLRLMQTN